MEQSPPCCALFVAFFDPVKGNTLEWSACSPNSPDKAALLDNVEMLVLAPGFEKIESTHTLFRHKTMPHMFGCAAFHKLSTGDAKERFARMRSVGVMGSSVERMRQLVPLLNWLSTAINQDPTKFTLLESASEVLFNDSFTVERCVDTFIADSQTSCVVSAHASDDKSNTSVPPAEKKNPITLQYAYNTLDHSSLLVIWRAILSQYRVLLFSNKHPAGLLCDLLLDLLCSGGEAASQPLFFRTYDYDLYSTAEVTDSSPSSPWFAATTDMRVVLGIGTSVPCWDILIDFDHGTSGAQFKQNPHISQSVRVNANNSNNNDAGLSSFTLHMTGMCDARVRQCIHKGNDNMWKQGIEYRLSPSHHSKTTNNVWDASTHRREFLKLWWTSLVDDINAIVEMENSKPELEWKYIHKKRKNAIKVLIRQKVFDSTHIPWLLFICEKRGVNVSGMTSMAILQLKLALFSNKFAKKSNNGKIVPINN